MSAGIRYLLCAMAVLCPTQLSSNLQAQTPPPVTCKQSQYPFVYPTTEGFLRIEFDVFRNGTPVGVISVAPIHENTSSISWYIDGDEGFQVLSPTNLQSLINQLCSGGISPVQQHTRDASLRLDAQTGSTPSQSGQASQTVFPSDLNGDGIPDLVDLSSGSVAVTLHSASGGVQSVKRYPAGPNPYFGLAADFNGDGKPDLLISNNGNSPGSGSGVSILINNGDGTFQAAKNTTINGSPWAIAAGDFNGDGKMDVAVTDQTLAVVWILLGNADGTLQNPVSLPVGTPVVYDNLQPSIIAADFNNDGIIDLAMLNTDPETISVLLGNGNGTFKTAVLSPVGSVVNSGAIGYVAFADLNHDGNLDLAVAYKGSNSIAILLGSGNGTFRPAKSYVTGNFPTSLGILPLNDGTFAFFTIDALTSSSVLEFAPGDGTLDAPPLYPVPQNHNLSGLTSIGAADLNGDQIPDVIAYNAQGGAVSVLLSNSDGSLQTPVRYTLSAPGRLYFNIPQSLAVGDLNGDGKPDVLATGAGTISVFLGNGNGTLSSEQTISVGIAPAGVVVADFNGDGKLDAAVADAGDLSSSGTSGSVWVLFGKGDGTFQSPVSYSAGALRASSLVAADFNGDGKPDLAIITSTYYNASPFVPGAVAILLNNGNGTFRTGTTLQAASTAQTIAVAAGDVNGDGKIDLAVAVQDQTKGDGAAIFLGNGDGTFRVAPYVAADETGPVDVTIADLNRDGNADLILSFCCGIADATHFLSKGDGTFQTPVHLPSGSSPVAVAVTDFNADGLPDLAFADGYGYVVALSGSFPIVSGSCSYFIGPALFQPGAAGGMFTVNISTNTSCAWTATGLPPWITAASATSGSGSGTVTINVAANTGATRSATINVAGRLVTITQGSPGCGFALNAGGEAFPAAGGSGAIAVTANQGCAWSANGTPGWITFSNGTGNGNGTASFTVGANVGAARSSVVVIGGISFTVEQSAASIAGLAATGSLGQVASEGTWDFSLIGINLGASAATARFSFADNNGNPLLLPLTFPQLSPASGPELASTLDRTLNPNAQVLMESTGPDNVAPLVGAGQLLSNGSVSGFGIFSNPKVHWNAVVPLETRNASKYILAFDNTAPLTTGVALANLVSQQTNVPVIIRDDTGAQIGNPTIPLSALGHTSFMLNDPQLGFPVTSGKRGTIEFDTPPGGQLSLLGLRANGPALTTLPVLADVGTSGGSITHVAYNGGWTSVFYIVNTGNASAQFTLSFFDENGIALSVPLLLPQSSTTMTSSGITRTLAPGETLVVDTNQQDSPISVVGSATLTTTGNISGFEIFRWNTFNQEASVPLETRTPNSFVLVFDDTNGLTTGVALATNTGVPVNITATFHDDTGAQIGAPQSISIPAHGHKSFLLPDLLQAVVGKRGMVEFAAPQGANISVIGLRAKSDGTLTTIPVLTK